MLFHESGRDSGFRGIRPLTILRLEQLNKYMSTSCDILDALQGRIGEQRKNIRSEISRGGLQELLTVIGEREAGSLAGTGAEVKGSKPDALMMLFVVLGKQVLGRDR
jgi:hypothetical protein